MPPNKKIIFITHFIPNDIGHGGNHRTYQILHDIETAVGKDNVILFCVPVRKYQYTKNPFIKTIRILRYWAHKYYDNPFKLIHKTKYSNRQFCSAERVEDYINMVSKIKVPVICVIEHSGFEEIVRYNNKNGITTISCIQNIESFDTNQIKFNKKYYSNTITSDFANELKILSLCQVRLFISKIETGLITGLDIPSQYYPYLPVGDIRKRLLDIRNKRYNGKIMNNLFLMIGTAAHSTTWDSMKRFILSAKKNGLPPNIEITVIGKKTDQLSEYAVGLSNVKYYGWIEQTELDNLLVKAKAIIAPHFFGFGALTRITEFACAGIPVAISSHSAMAVNIPPGVTVVDDNWNEWYAAIEKLATEKIENNENDYQVWEKQQNNTLIKTLKKYIT